MDRGMWRKLLVIAVVFVLAWGLIRYFFPLIAPFLLGWFLAALAEPMVRFLCGRLRFGRILGTGIGVSLVIAVLVGIVWVITAFGWRELGALARGIPQYVQALSGKTAQIQDWAVSLAARAPGELGQMLSGMVNGAFARGGMVLEAAASGVLSAAGSMAGKLPGGALSLGTAVISGYMISAQYPDLRRKVLENPRFREKWLPMLLGIRDTVGQWLRAQAKLTGVSFAILSAGFLLLRVEHWLLLSVVTALVDAIPMLGTGTVLVPMALLSFLWGERVRGIGLLGLYVTAMLTRSALEPRLVGKQLGMNPLLTLGALYVGFRLWGVAGMILAPILAVTAVRLSNRREQR